MTIERFIPSDILKPFVRTYMIIGSELGMNNKVLPDTSLTLAFRYKGMISYEERGVKSSLPSAAISGIRKSTRLLCYEKNTSILLIVFREAGAAMFFNEPLHELYGVSLPLDTLLARQFVSDIEERLAEAKSNLDRVTLAEQFLLCRLKASKSDKLIIDAISKIQATHGEIRIKDLLSELPISQDPFEKRFRRVAGSSPKQFASIVRLRRLIYDKPYASSLTDIALSAGYFDQAHFTKDFKSFTGQTPLEFFKSSSFW